MKVVPTDKAEIARPKVQNPFTDIVDKCEHLGFVPFEKRVAMVMNAGLSRQVLMERTFGRSELFDGDGEEDFLPPPPLPRHLDADLAEVSELAREYAQRKAQIEERIAAKAAQAKLEQKVQVPPAAGKQGGEPPADDK